MSDEDNEKTEEPSPEKRRKAREEGNLARSKDSGPIAATIAVLLALSAFGAAAYHSYVAFAETCFGALERAGPEAVFAKLTLALPLLAALTIPVAGAAALGAILIGIAEVGLQMNWSLLEPKWNRLDPIAKLPKIFAPGQAAVMTLLTLLRVAAVVLVTTKIISSEFDSLSRLPQMSIEQGTKVVLTVITSVALWATGVLAILSALDYGHSWWKREQSLRMSRQEVKEEHHQQEGDPRMKGRQRQRAREMLRRGIVAQVKTSDVIVANPTHVAVALRYRPEEGAPVVTAKGVDEIAQHIKKVAKEHGVPVVESVQLARALNAQVKIGRPIPLEYFQAVAEVLAYVYRLKRRGLQA